MFWYETSLDSSFVSGENSDGTVITQWKDNNPQTTYKYSAFAGQKTASSSISYNTSSGATSGNTSGPTYIENGINGIPTLRFTNNATSAYRYLAVDGSAKNNSGEGITAFAVVNYRSGTGWIYDRVCINSSTVPTDCSSSITGGNPLFGTETDNIGLITMYPTKIGHHAENDTDNLDIDISEVIFFAGRVKTEDRRTIEAYLGKKYGIKVN